MLRYRTPASAGSGQAHSISANVTHQGQVAQTAGSFMPTSNAVAVDVGGVTPGETVTGDRQVRAAISSGTAQRMDLLVDGTTVASSSGQPTSIVGDLTRLPPGDHDLVVRVADTVGTMTVQHVPFTVAGAATPEAVAIPGTTAEASQQVQAVPSEPPLWLLGVFVVLLLGAAALFFLGRMLFGRPVAAAAAAAAAQDDATLDLETPRDGAATAEGRPLLRVDNQGQQREVTLGSEPVSIGRDADNSIVLRDAHVSRHHARISLEDGHYWIQDLKSQNGTLLNGQVAVDRRQLEPGDQFAIGGATMTYVAPARSEEQEAAQAPVAAGANNSR